MTYFVYDAVTTQILASSKTERGAKSKRTRMQKKYYGVIGVMESQKFYNEVEATRKVKNFMSGEEVEIAYNTPHVCDPSSETYWSL